jgi:sulfofructose kinase
VKQVSNSGADIKSKSGVLVGVGITAMDHSVLIERYPGKNDKVEALETANMPGGPVCNALIAAQAVGIQTRLVTVLGKDTAGRFIRDRLRKFGIQIDWIIEKKTNQTPEAYIWVDKNTGDRAIVLDRLKSCAIEIEDVDDCMLSNACGVITDGRWFPAMKEIMTRATNSGIPVLLDAGSMRDGMEYLLSRVDCVIASRVFALKFTRTDDMRAAIFKLKKKCSGNVAITLGKEGVIAVEHNEIVRLPAFTVAVKDTTGAGDVFHGVFAAFRYGNKKKSFSDCLRIASIAAAYSCRYLGGCYPDIPVDDIINLSKQLDL